jgi:hypothetical protein
MPAILIGVRLLIARKLCTEFQATGELETRGFFIYQEKPS